MQGWERIVAEAKQRGPFPLPPYSEYMPPPYIGVKPYMPDPARRDATNGITRMDALDIDEYEQVHDLAPGLDRIGEKLVEVVGKLLHGAHALSKTLLDGNPAWDPQMVHVKHDPLIVIAPLALSRSQDDKGMARWTLFGTSHRGAACWDMFDERAMAALIKWAKLDTDWRTLGGPYRTVGDSLPKVLVTFTPFAQLPERVRTAYLAGDLVLVPTPASLVFYEHSGYRRLAEHLPRATQIPLLHLFERVEGSCAIRIPQSGWLDELGTDPHGHAVKNHIERRHRWQRIPRDAGLQADAYADKVSVALFATDPVSIDLYNKPLARNSQVWTHEYRALLDGPRADHAALARAAKAVAIGGRYGYRMYYPPMRAGQREVFWHYPLVAGRHGRHEGPVGVVTAEGPKSDMIELVPNLLARDGHTAAAKLSVKEASNLRKLYEARELLDGPLVLCFARALLRIPKHDTLESWLAAHRTAAPLLGRDTPPAAPLVLGGFGTRAIEEQIWNTIAYLAHGAIRQKNDADGIAVNKGKHGGPAAKKAGIHVHARSDLEALGDHLHARYRELLGTHGVGEVVAHVFRWQSDHAFPWMDGWRKNQAAPAERNIVMMIPGRNRGQAVIMGDHYDTAYMEDEYWEEKGGDLLRAPAAGADDNHCATTALLLAAEHLLPLAAAGKLERDVWLIHLTGEEYPADCMGARANAQGLVERTLAITADDGTHRDVSHDQHLGAYILDMVGHNTERDRDVFQLAPGAGAGSQRHARIAQ